MCRYVLLGSWLVDWISKVCVEAYGSQWQWQRTLNEEERHVKIIRCVKYDGLGEAELGTTEWTLY